MAGGFKVRLIPTGLDEATQELVDLARMDPKSRYGKAKKSASRSTGFYIRGVLRSYMEKSPWRRSSRVSIPHGSGREIRDSKGRHTGGLSWWGRFVRYAVSADGERMKIGFARSRKGRRGRLDDDTKFDPDIDAIIRKHEYGETIMVSERMRRKFPASTRIRGARKAGGDYHAIRETTRVIAIPKRPMVEPVRRMVRKTAPKWWEKKFYKNLEKYA